MSKVVRGGLEKKRDGTGLDTLLCYETRYLGQLDEANRLAIDASNENCRN